jgi:hypothetical protein
MGRMVRSIIGGVYMDKNPYCKICGNNNTEKCEDCKYMIGLRFQPSNFTCINKNENQ